MKRKRLLRRVLVPLVLLVPLTGCIPGLTCIPAEGKPIVCAN